MMLYADTTTKTPDLFNPVLNFRLPAKPTRQRLRLRAVANLSGWYFVLADYESRAVVCRDIGTLPAGFCFNQETAELYALSCAARWIACNLPDAVVSLICTATPLPRREAKGRRAA